MTPNKQPHLTGHDKETGKNYVHIGESIGIDTAKKLFDVCSQCSEFPLCDKSKVLYHMLKENDPTMKY